MKYKKLIPALIICLLFTSSLIAQQRGFRSINIEIDGQTKQLYRGSHALVIGVSNYTDGWPDLPGVIKDIEKVKAALEKHDFNVVLVKNPSDRQMDDAFDDFIRNYGSNKENRLFFYFAGHGHTIKTSYGEELGYIVPANAPNPNYNSSGFQQKAMEMAQIEIFAKRIQSKHALFLFDACFSGSLFALSRAIPENISWKTSKHVRQFITSGSANETVPDRSIFCNQFISSMDGEADVNDDGYITGTELGEFLQSSVINYSRNSQHPQYGKIRNPNLDKGDFVFILDSPPQDKPGSKIEITEERSNHMGSIKLTTELEDKPTLDYSKNINHIDFSGNSGIFIDVRDSQRYNWVKIGAQIWMAENLRFDNVNSLGYYRWGKALKACPNGWHLPSETEWIELINYLGGEDVAGSKLKETKFTALPSGFRYAEGNIGKREDAYWWSSTKRNGLYSWAWVIYKNDGKATRHSSRKALALPVRCLKN